MDQEDSNITLETDKAVVSTLPKTLQESYRKRLGELLDLTPEQEKRLKAWLKKRLGEWQADTSELHKMLEDDNDLLEGYVDEPTGVYQGWGSNVHVDVIGIYMEVFQSIEKRSILGAETIWHAETEDEELWDYLADIENIMNYKARNEWNIEEMIPMAIWAKNRDSLCAIQVTWDEDYKKTRDVLFITSLDDFLSQFQTPEDAGIDVEEWTSMAKYISENASDETPIEIPVTSEKRVYYGNRASIVEYIDFVTIPATAQTIKAPECRAYGKRFRERKEQIRQKLRDKVYYEAAAKTLLEKGGSDEDINRYIKSQDYIEGLKRTNTKSEIESFELVVRGRIDGNDGEEEEYLVTYNLRNNLLLRVTEYPYRRDFYALFRLNRRPNRLPGKSVPQKGRQMNEEIDTQHNQRINARYMTVPSFKIHPDAKKDWDPEAPQNRWRPGIFVELADFTKLEQFVVQPTDQGESMAEEANDFRILDLSIGAPAALFTGQAPSGDPNAPGNKTAMLINQGNMRMDDILEEDREGIAELGMICLSHLYQFGPPILQYTASQTMGGAPPREIKTVHKKILRNGIKLNMRGVTVISNPDAEMAKALQLHSILSSVPEYQANPQYRNNLLRDAMAKGRIEGRNRYLPTLDEMKQQQVEVTKQAILKIQAEKIAAAKAAQEQMVKNNLAKAQQNLRIRKVAQDTAASNLDPNQNGGMPLPQEAPNAG